MRIGGDHRWRRGVAGLVVAVMVFALIFTVGLTYVLYQGQADLTSYQANANYLAVQQMTMQESLAIGAKNSSTGQLTLIVNNTGGIPLSVMSAFVKDSSGSLVSSEVMDLGGSCTPGQAAPLNLNTGGTGSFTISTSCYTYSSGKLIFISLTTSRGNTFTEQFPLNMTYIVTTRSSTYTTTLTAPAAGGGNSLVLVMAATPIQAFGGNVVTDNVTAFNYSKVPIVGLTLDHNPPDSNKTGTVTLTPKGCTGPYTPPGAQPDPTGTIQPYSGSGTAPHVYFLCQYKVNTGSVGGLVSFSGQAYGMQGTSTVYSAGVTSNLVQVGGLTNVLSVGAFSSDFFFFKYSSSSIGMPPSNVWKLPQASVIKAGSNRYVAFYVQLTNNFNTTLPLLATTNEQLDQSAGGESDWWIVGTNATVGSDPGMVGGGVVPGDNWQCGANCVYYPTYGGSPWFTPYPSNCNVVDANNRPTNPSCIYVNPGQTVIVALAACGPSSSTWNWGSQTYGYRNWGGCVSSPPFIGSGGSATAANTVVTFEYKGQTYTQDLAFQAVAFIG